MVVASCQPTISVCIPTFNSEKFIGAAIASVLSQDFSDFELIVIDNDSTDSTRFIVEGYRKNDNRIVLIKNEENIGMVGNFNRCLENSRGKYIKFLCSDDILLEKYTLQRFISIAEKINDLALVASARNIIDHEGTYLRTVREYSGIFWCGGLEIINDCLLSNRNKIGEPTSVMFPRKLVTRGFDSRYKQILDLEFWFNLLENGCFAYTDEPLVGFRKHENQTTKLHSISLEHINDTPLLYNSYLYKNSLGYGKREKNYLWFSYYRSVWKLYKKNKISKEIFDKILKNNSNILVFYFKLPFYSFLKKYIKSSILINMNKID